ncbi:MAG: hypothetical protein Q8L11_01180 [Candidatus Moranbacteria bacterium]|nr:hypothetical protein [Candidatus Moranbacteria bacterium]
MEKKSEIIEIERERTPSDHDHLYEFVNKNFYLIRNLIYIEDSLEELSKEPHSMPKYFGQMDIKKIKAKRVSFEVEKIKILDILIDQLEKNNGQIVIPDNDSLLDTFEEILDAKNGVDDDYDEEVEDGEDEFEQNHDDQNIDLIEDDEFEDDNDFDISTMLRSRIIERDTIDEPNKHDGIKLEKDHMHKLKQARDSINKLKEADSIFDPQDELLNISKLSNSAEEKKNSIKGYKENLRSQMLGIGEINAYLEQYISDIERIDIAKLKIYFQEEAKKWKLSPWQMERYEMVFNKFEEKINVINTHWEANKHLSAKELFEKISGHLMVGKIEVEKYPLTLIFYLYDKTDCARIFFGSNQEITDEEINKSDEIWGQHVGIETIDEDGNDITGIIIINKNILREDNEIRETVVHEYKHEINNLVQKALAECEIRPEEISNMINREMQMDFNRALDKGKDEMLAYYKSGKDSLLIYQGLIEKNGEYDYFSSEEDLKNKAKFYEGEDDWSQILMQELQKLQESLRVRYHEILMRAVVVINELELLGFDNGKIVGLLQIENIKNWTNVLKRIEDSTELIVKNKDDIDAQVNYYNKRNERLRKVLLRNEKSFIIILKKLLPNMMGGVLDPTDDEIRKYLENEMEFNKVAANRLQNLLKEHAASEI